MSNQADEPKIPMNFPELNLELPDLNRIRNNTQYNTFVRALATFLKNEVQYANLGKILSPLNLKEIIELVKIKFYDPAQWFDFVTVVQMQEGMTEINYYPELLLENQQKLHDILLVWSYLIIRQQGKNQVQVDSVSLFDTQKPLIISYSTGRKVTLQECLDELKSNSAGFLNFVNSI